MISMEDELTYKFVARQRRIKQKIGHEEKKVDVIHIGLHCNETGITLPYPPFTYLIKKLYKNKGSGINTQAQFANILCRFLNFILERIEEGDKLYLELKYTGIHGLKLTHGSEFITYLTNNQLSRDTVKIYMNYLSNFYWFLQEMKIIAPEKTITKDKEKDTVTNPFLEPFLDTELPNKHTVKLKSKRKLKDFGELRYSLTNELINFSLDVVPEISLGLCFQFYGGMRRGEVVNISLKDLRVVEYESINVRIVDNSDLLFSRLKDRKKENPKRLNYLGTTLSQQAILDTDLVWQIYEYHMKELDIKRKRDELKNPYLLFSDDNGEPMSGAVYDKRVKDLKKAFESELRERLRYEELEFFTDYMWGSHIGRGVFTNFLFDMGFNFAQVAAARGDKSLTSVLEYLDERTTSALIKEAKEELKNIPIENLGTISEKHLKNWRQVYKTRGFK